MINTLIMLETFGHILKEILPNTAPSIKVAIGTVAEPIKLTGANSRLGINFCSQTRTIKPAVKFATRGGVINS